MRRATRFPGVRLVCGLSHREFELRDFGTAGTGVRRLDAQAQGGQKEDCCKSSNHNVLQDMRAWDGIEILAVRIFADCPLLMARDLLFERTA
jgi:hypothetical protein